MTATGLFKAGQLAAAVDAQLADVKAHPADDGKRIFLFELLLFTGDINRAAKQLDVVRADTPEMAVAVAGYREVVAAERKRRGLATGGAPGFLGDDPPAHARLRLEALRTAPADPKRAAELLSQADEHTPVVGGILNGSPFVGLRDADDYFASVVEVFAHGEYLWVGVDQIAAVAMNPPKYPRDVLYPPARLTLHDGTTGEVFLPALYPGSHAHADDAVRLGRLTVWDGEAGAVRGAGQRVFLSGDDDRALLEWRAVQILPQGEG